MCTVLFYEYLFVAELRESELAKLDVLRERSSANAEPSAR